MSPQHQIAVINQDRDTSTLLMDYLQRFGFGVHAGSDGLAMDALLASQPIDLLVLGRDLPGRNGLMLTREVRARSPLPIIMLNDRADAYERVLGLEMGADDCITQPFEPRELVARIQTVLRRTSRRTREPDPSRDLVRFDGWALHRHTRFLTSPDGEMIALSNAEFRLLCTFLQAPRRLLSRDQLMEQARGRSREALERGIDLLVSRLRGKLHDDPRNPTLIRTVRGAGYLFNARHVDGSALLSH